MLLLVSCFKCFLSHLITGCVLSYWESVTELQPRIDDIMKCPGKVMIVTAAAPQGSAYDFCSRLFAPKLGFNEVNEL